MNPYLVTCDQCGAWLRETCIDLVRQQELPYGIHHKVRINKANLKSEMVSSDRETLKPSPAWSSR